MLSSEARVSHTCQLALIFSILLRALDHLVLKTTFCLEMKEINSKCLERWLAGFKQVFMSVTGYALETASHLSVSVLRQLKQLEDSSTSLCPPSLYIRQAILWVSQLLNPCSLIWTEHLGTKA